ncbi:MAG: hypothetical protein AAF512_00225, partial [Pseudomonadota bacterium]
MTDLNPLKRRELAKNFDLLSELLNRVESQYYTETRADEKFRLERRIAEVRADRDGVEAALEKLENGQGLEPEEERFSLPPNPYKGLHAFQEEDAPYFVGRIQETNLLLEQVERESFVALVGASGSGKSSLVKAGLIPRLRDNGNWLITEFRPGDDPFRALARALAPVMYDDPIAQAEHTKALIERLTDGRIELAEICYNITQKHHKTRLLLLADQFEELYTLTADKAVQHNFAERLLQPLQSSGDLTVTVLLTMRADFMGQATSDTTLAEALNRSNHILGPMSSDSLRLAIERPAAAFGVELAEGLTDSILTDLGDEPGNLPLLEFALAELWTRQQDHQLSHQAYQDIGGVKRALAKHADTIYAEFDPTEQQRLRDIFIQLVRPGEGVEDTRQVATRAQVREDNWTLVKQLADARLVVTGNQNEQDTVEVVHEALIRHWQPLKEWMDTDRDFRRWQNSLRQAIQSWQVSGQDEGGLLRGAQLETAKEQQVKYHERLSEEEQAFIQDSLAAQQRDERRKRLTQYALIGLTALAVLTAGLAGLQWQSAEREKERANQNTIIANHAQQTAEQEKRKAIRAQSLFLSDLAGREFFDKKNLVVGTLLSLEALPKSEINPDRELVFEANSQLHNITARWPGVMAHNGAVVHVAFSPDGQRIVTASRDNTARLWSLDGTEQAVLKGHQSAVYHAAFSPDGQRIVTASEDNTARLWSLDGTEQAVLKGHTELVSHAAFSPDGQRIVTASSDNTARLWSLDGTEQAVLKGHQSAVYHAAFSP